MKKKSVLISFLSLLLHLPFECNLLCMTSYFTFFYLFFFRMLKGKDGKLYYTDQTGEYDTKSSGPNVRAVKTKARQTASPNVQGSISDEIE